MHTNSTTYLCKQYLPLIKCYRTAVLTFGLLTLINLAACGGPTEKPPIELKLVFNEVISDNEGVNIDEQGELDDWFELANASDLALNLKDFTITDSGDEHFPLPDITLQPQEVVVLWADDTPEQGPLHLPFKLSSDGETLTIFNAEKKVVDKIDIPALEENQGYTRFPSVTGTFSLCRYTSPNKHNGSTCKAVATPTVKDDYNFAEFDPANWPSDQKPTALGINELALQPANFIEVKNFGDYGINLNEYKLMIGPMNANSALPSWDANNAIHLPNLTLAPGELASVGLTAAQTEALVLQPFFEGAAVLYKKVPNNTTATLVDHIPFMHWPNQAILSRKITTPYNFVFCANATQDTPNNCDTLASRSLGDRSRGLYTRGDFETLAEGTGLANIASVKFVMDLQRNNAVHYLSSKRWPLHYTFVREAVNGQPELNRCDAFEEQQFNQGWSLFSQQNYFNTQTRRYHLGTLSHHANANIDAVEFTFGDAITATQMYDTFYSVTARVPSPTQWSLRPQDGIQASRVQAIEGQLPIVGPNAPFKDLTMQTLATGVAFGTLKFVNTADLETALLGPRTIVITNDVPNDINFVGGLITEAFQTPLAHVNILSQGRGTPNLALPDARSNSDIAALLNKLVRFEVSSSGYNIKAATAEQAEAFWAAQIPSTEILTPRLNTATEGLIDLSSTGIHALPSIGAKAAQLAELFQISSLESNCSVTALFEVPEGGFAIPVRYYLQHFTASGAQAYLDGESQEDLFTTDLDYRRIVLATVQQMILEHPVDAALLSRVESRVNERFGEERTRFRSSSNTEDLSTFNGAGLYTSISAAIGDKKRKIDDAMRTVWASLWNLRAFEERSYANVDQTQVAMGILVHQAFRNERANGVAMARNILDPVRSDQYYFNSQAGEASVTNPAPGVITEQLVYQWPPRTPRITYHSNSSLTDTSDLNGGAVISPTEVRTLACAMSAIQNHFRPLLDPQDEDRWFTMESEFKFLGPERQFLIKQARPYPFGHLNIANDCREL